MLHKYGAIEIEKETPKRKQIYYKEDIIPDTIPYVHKTKYASKHEALFASLLEEKDIAFQSQVVYKDCIYKRHV